MLSGAGTTRSRARGRLRRCYCTRPSSIRAAARQNWWRRPRKTAASYSLTFAVRSAKIWGRWRWATGASPWTVLSSWIAGVNPTNRADAVKHRVFQISLANARLGARARCTENVSDAEKTPTDPATRDHLVSATMGFPWDTITASATARMPEFAQSPGSIDFREGIDPF